MKIPLKGLNKLTTFLIQSRKIAQRNGYSTTGLLRRVFYLFYFRGLLPWNALVSGLLQRNLSDQALEGTLGKRRLLKLQDRVNPKQFQPRTQDKDVFYRFCDDLNLPIPKMYAVFSKPAGWCWNGSSLTTREDWVRFFTEEVPEQFVIKPTGGTYGIQVHVFKRTAGGFEEARGRICSAGQIYEELAGDLRFKKYVVQEQLKSHPDLVRLSNTEFLQTLRLVTYVDQEGKADVYFHQLKIIAGNSPVDNYALGALNNGVCPVRHEDGSLTPALMMAPDKLAIEMVSEHPGTRQSLTNFHVPFWKEALALAKQAALLFLPLRSIGWDIAITPQGPVLVEGNSRWDPCHYNIVATEPDSAENALARKLIAHLETNTVF